MDLDNARRRRSWSDAARCLIAVVDPASGVPACVDSQLGYINGVYRPTGEQTRSIEFDAAGAIYYTGYTTTGRTVLRRYLNGVATDLIDDNISVSDFLVRPRRQRLHDRLGNSASTGASWVRRVSPSGGLQTHPIDEPARFLRAFPDGNIYMGLMYDECVVRRYQTASTRSTQVLDRRPQGGRHVGPHFSSQSLCRAASAGATRRSAAPCGATDQGHVSTSDEKVFAVASWGADGVAHAVLPRGACADHRCEEGVRRARASITNLILAGRTRRDEDVLTLYNTSDRHGKATARAWRPRSRLYTDLNYSRERQQGAL